jgi:hypothetical protein
MMADATAAINYVLSWEDAGLTGVITETHDGMRTRFGIDEHYHPELTSSLFFSSMGATAALGIALAIYRTTYCPPLCIEEIANQAEANKLLSLGVNLGVERASKMLQDILCVEGDGRIGPLTLQKLEYSDPPQVLKSLREEAENYYRAIVKAHPEKRVFLDGWLRRAAA